MKNPDFEEVGIFCLHIQEIVCYPILLDFLFAKRY